MTTVGRIGIIEKMNCTTLRECREQVFLTLDEVQKKVPRIQKMEQGEIAPTFNQLEVLAKLYGVPDWVFIAKKLPEKYHFATNPSFRRLRKDKKDALQDAELIKVVHKTDTLMRTMLLNFRENAKNPIPAFSPPPLKEEAADMAISVRQWLDCSAADCFDFDEWRRRLEDKNIFVFMTGKYPGFSKIDINKMRGLAIFRDVLPMIIINDSDSYKAQSFTLFHELGHLLKKQSTLDTDPAAEYKNNKQTNHRQKEEKWCDDLAGSILMPSTVFMQEAQKYDLSELKGIGKLAAHFKISTYACLVRAVRATLISRQEYYRLELELKEQNKREGEKQKESKGGPPRNRAKEIVRQFGNIYLKTVWQAYYDQEIGLHKLCKLVGAKSVDHVMKTEDMV